MFFLLILVFFLPGLGVIGTLQHANNLNEKLIFV